MRAAIQLLVGGMLLAMAAAPARAAQSTGCPTELTLNLAAASGSDGQFAALRTRLVTAVQEKLAEGYRKRMGLVTGPIGDQLGLCIVQRGSSSDFGVVMLLELKSAGTAERAEPQRLPTSRGTALVQGSRLFISEDMSFAELLPVARRWEPAAMAPQQLVVIQIASEALFSLGAENLEKTFLDTAKKYQLDLREAAALPALQQQLRLTRSLGQHVKDLTAVEAKLELVHSQLRLTLALRARAESRLARFAAQQQQPDLRLLQRFGTAQDLLFFVSARHEAWDALDLNVSDRTTTLPWSLLEQQFLSDNERELGALTGGSMVISASGRSGSGQVLLAVTSDRPAELLSHLLTRQRFVWSRTMTYAQEASPALRQEPEESRLLRERDRWPEWVLSGMQPPADERNARRQVLIADRSGPGHAECLLTAHPYGASDEAVDAALRFTSDRDTLFAYATTGPTLDLPPPAPVEDAKRLAGEVDLTKRPWLAMHIESSRIEWLGPALRPLHPLLLVATFGQVAAPDSMELLKPRSADHAAKQEPAAESKSEAPTSPIYIVGWAERDSLKFRMHLSLPAGALSSVSGLSP